MTKAMLIIDTGNDPCWTCDLCVPLEDGSICGKLGSYITAIDRELECPLTQYPERMTEREVIEIENAVTCTYKNIYAKGWNACLDTLKEKENE